MTGLETLVVVVLGTLVGLDVASVPQAMFSRPIVAGLLGGLVTGNPLPGLAIGAILELFALDTLPVGATRNPDWGPGSLAVGALAGARSEGILASGVLGLVLVAVVAAWVGGWSSHMVRRANVHAVERQRARLDAGDYGAVVAVQRAGLLRDTARSFGLTALAIALGDLLASLFAREWPGPQTAARVALAATSLGIALHAGWRLAGTGREGLWFVGGLGAGLVAAVLWLA